MTTWYVELSATPPRFVDRARFEDHIEAVLDELSKLEGINDADAMVDFGEPRVTFSMVVEADDHPEAVGQIQTAMRTAIHAAGGGTPGWEKEVDRMSQDARYDIRHEDALT